MFVIPLNKSGIEFISFVFTNMVDCLWLKMKVRLLVILKLFLFVKTIFWFQFTSTLYGGHPKIVIPDYKKYVVDENTPELLKLQERLKAKGLKDPWIRNEVWRYDMREMFVNYGERIRWTMGRGVLTGAIFGGVLALLYPMYYRRVLISKGRDPDHAHHCKCHHYMNLLSKFLSTKP